MENVNFSAEKFFDNFHVDSIPEISHSCFMYITEDDEIHFSVAPICYSELSFSFDKKLKKLVFYFPSDNVWRDRAWIETVMKLECFEGVLKSNVYEKNFYYGFDVNLDQPIPKIISMMSYIRRPFEESCLYADSKYYNNVRYFFHFLMKKGFKPEEAFVIVNSLSWAGSYDLLEGTKNDNHIPFPKGTTLKQIQNKDFYTGDETTFENTTGECCSIREHWDVFGFYNTPTFLGKKEMYKAANEKELLSKIKEIYEKYLKG